MDIRPAILVATALLGACARDSATMSPADNADARVARAIGRCGLRGQIDVRVYPPDGIAIERLDPNARYESVECFLRALRPLGVVGFVGNEAPPEN